MKSRITVSLCIASLIILLFSACSTNRVITNNVTGFYFDTIVNIRIDSNIPLKKGTEEELRALLQNYDEMLSKTNKSSDIYNINSNPGIDVEVNSETLELIKRALYYEELCNDGEFSCTVGALTSLWDYKSENPKIPSETDINNALKGIGANHVHIDDTKNTVNVDEGTYLDLGGIAKGFVADKVREYLNQEGITGGVINLGGNVLVFNNSGSSRTYNIGIQRPFSENADVIAVIKKENASIVTSGSYQRYFKGDDGKIYHHILDTKTGYPAESDINSVTIVSDSSVDGDALSTICFILGKDKGLEFIDSLTGVEALFIDKNDSIFTTDGVQITEK